MIMCINDVVGDIVKSIKPKTDVFKITQSDIRKHFTYNKKTGILKVKKPWGSLRSLMKKGDVINKDVVYFNGVNIMTSHIIFIYVKGIKPDHVYMKDDSQGYIFNNLTTNYKESVSDKATYDSRMRNYKTSKVKRVKPLPTQEKLKYLFSYKEGCLFWNVDNNNGTIKGSLAGWVNGDGRRSICIEGFHYDSELLIGIYLNNNSEYYVNYHNRNKRFKYENILDFDYEGVGTYKSYKNGDKIDLRNY